MLRVTSLLHIARAFGSVMGVPYLAGHWLDPRYLATSLYWERWALREHRLNRKRLKNGCPSWSWASYAGNVTWHSTISTTTFASIESVVVFPSNSGDMYPHSSSARIWITGRLNRAQVRRRDGLKDDAYNLVDGDNNVISQVTFDELHAPNIVSCLLMDDEITDPPSPLRSSSRANGKDRSRIQTSWVCIQVSS